MLGIEGVPVESPQLSKLNFLRGKSGFILTTQEESTTVYSLKVDVLRKWNIGSLRSLLQNLTFPSLGISFLIGLTPKFWHMFVSERRHGTQLPHSP